MTQCKEVELKLLAVCPADVQLLEYRRFVISEICRVFSGRAAESPIPKSNDKETV
jgi:hypothetical protein